MRGNVPDRAQGPTPGSRHLTYGVIDWASTTDGAEVKLNDVLVAQYRAGRLTYLTDAVFERLVKRDEAAAQLWVFLERALPAPGRRPEVQHLPAPEGKPGVDKHVAPIAELLASAGRCDARWPPGSRRPPTPVKKIRENSSLVERAQVPTMRTLLAVKGASNKALPEAKGGPSGDGDSQGRKGGNPGTLTRVSRDARGDSQGRRLPIFLQTTKEQNHRQFYRRLLPSRAFLRV